MSGLANVRLFVATLMLIAAIGLVAAFQPGTSTLSAAPYAPTIGYAAPPNAYGGPPPWGTYHPGSWNAPRRPLRNHFRRGGGFRSRPMMPAPAYVGYPTHTLAFDGWRLLAVLVITGTFAGVVWPSRRERTPLEGNGQSSLSEGELGFLREEVYRLQSEQRQLRAALDWQERLLARVGRPDGVLERSADFRAAVPTSPAVAEESRRPMDSESVPVIRRPRRRLTPTDQGRPKDWLR